ncbi:hypothetical protein BdWA1_002090 [Babesia duncani]|uniref:Uncharacterized protein n=1 Tax=Babesia duncani TaxID=323732 RepID=A0AAD9UPC7_9APIC|nr:hypothetical protein BdWA1_002090 [Babesia duncani]
MLWNFSYSDVLINLELWDKFMKEIHDLVIVNESKEIEGCILSYYCETVVNLKYTSPNTIDVTRLLISKCKEKAEINNPAVDQVMTMLNLTMD